MTGWSHFKISQSASGLRSDDTAKLKTAILTYIHEDPKHGSKFASDYEVEMLITSDSKVFHGFQHLDTGDLLCPLRLKAEFERDPL